MELDFTLGCALCALCEQLVTYWTRSLNFLEIRCKYPLICVIFPQNGGILLGAPCLGLFGGVFFLAEVRVQEGEPLENALRRFKRKVQTEDIIKEVKRHSFYLKPGEKKRVKEALARKRNRKKVRKEQD
jgi:small subunit ribosomal protein S21